MNFASRRLHRGNGLSERGQMAIFIALIFQVLFVFFAMIVNIGLIVQDKINLQNSVDLAAYYGAERQAEILNAIAHENYQIRQAWKLLAWRIRVLGDLGYEQHPMQKEYTGTTQDVPAFSQGFGGGSSRVPVICVNHTLWGAKDQSLCYKSNLVVPSMPSGVVVAPVGYLGSFNILAALHTNQLKTVGENDCIDTGPLNFNLAIRWITAYRVQVAHSKKMIRMYADLLSQSPSDFKDIYGKSAMNGAFKTLSYNLTRANKEFIDKTHTPIHFFNSLGALSDRKKWLNEVPIYPIIFYTDFESPSNCTAVQKPIFGNTPQQNIPKYYQGIPSNEVQMMRTEPNDPDNEYHSIFGVEKNPWAMAYVGVYAETKPRKPYLPFGDPIILRAKAFAKPFGGRIGPWMFRKWPVGNLQSAGNSEDKLDRLMPLPLDPNSLGPASEVELGIPNYSRFPGDQLGLLSRKALTAFKKTMRDKYFAVGKFLNPSFYTGTPTGYDGLAMILPGNPAGTPSPLLLGGYAGPWIRDFEAAAVAPDLFDITYYSIDKDFFNNYAIEAHGGDLISEQDYPLDMGSLDYNNLNTVKNIGDQIRVASVLEDPGAYWAVRDEKNLLTAWAPSGPFEYKFPETFGKCSKESKVAVPGMCAVGGRVGYSVKIVSEEYLKSDQLPLGGEGIKGPLTNPPPADF